MSAKVVVELAKAGEIQAAVLLHPSFVSVDDFKGIICFCIYLKYFWLPQVPKDMCLKGL